MHHRSNDINKRMEFEVNSNGIVSIGGNINQPVESRLRNYSINFCFLLLTAAASIFFSIKFGDAHHVSCLNLCMSGHVRRLPFMFAHTDTRKQTKKKSATTWREKKFSKMVRANTECTDFLFPYGGAWNTYTHTSFDLFSCAEQMVKCEKKW